jgi:hypothetical protein
MGRKQPQTGAEFAASRLTIMPKGGLAERNPSRSDMEFITRMLARRSVSYLSTLTTLPEVGTVVGAQITIPSNRIRFTFDVYGRFQTLEKR